MTQHMPQDVRVPSKTFQNRPTIITIDKILWENA